MSQIIRKKMAIIKKKQWKDNPEIYYDRDEKMRGGHDIVKHHYLYDHSDLLKNTVGITRSDHMRLHKLLQKLGYIVPHIKDKGL